MGGVDGSSIAAAFLCYNAGEYIAFCIEPDVDARIKEGRGIENAYKSPRHMLGS
jgi:hypothetical protein